MVNKPIDEASPFLEKQVAFFVGTFEIPMIDCFQGFNPFLDKRNLPQNWVDQIDSSSTKTQ